MKNIHVARSTSTSSSTFIAQRKDKAPMTLRRLAIAVFPLLSFSAFAAEGAGSSGGGGTGMICAQGGQTVVEMVDSYEARQERRPVVESRLPVAQQIEEALARLQAISPAAGKMVRDAVARAQKDARDLPEGVEIELPIDAFSRNAPLLRQRGCRLAGVGYYRDPSRPTPWNGRLDVDSQLFATMSPTQQAVFWVHEAVYLLNRLNNNVDVVKVRELVARVFAASNDSAAIAGLLEEMGFPSTGLFYKPGSANRVSVAGQATPRIPWPQTVEINNRSNNLQVRVRPHVNLFSRNPVVSQDWSDLENPGGPSAGTKLVKAWQGSPRDALSFAYAFNLQRNELKVTHTFVGLPTVTRAPLVLASAPTRGAEWDRLGILACQESYITGYTGIFRDIPRTSVRWKNGPCASEFASLLAQLTHVRSLGAYRSERPYYGRVTIPMRAQDIAALETGTAYYDDVVVAAQEDLEAANAATFTGTLRDSLGGTIAIESIGVSREYPGLLQEIPVKLIPALSDL